MKNLNLFLIYSILLFIFIELFGYDFFLREYVLDYFQGDSPLWFQKTVDAFYPRLAIEKHRFETLFFIQKADQVIIRSTIVLGIIQICLLLIQFRTKIWDDFWKLSQNTSHTHKIIIAFYLTFSLFNISLFQDITIWKDHETFYKPILLLQWQKQLPSIYILYSCVFFYFFFTISIVFIKNKTWISIVISLLFIYLHGISLSFEKIDHTFTPCIYTLLLLPIYFLSKSSTWVLRLIQISIISCYTLAGFEKLMISGIDWVDPQSFQNYLILSDTAFGNLIVSNKMLCTILPILGMLFQLSFIGSITKFRYIWILGGVSFHLSTYLLFGAGWYISPWVVSYLFFFLGNKKTTDIKNINW